jgi:hypothetical protein
MKNLFDKEALSDVLRRLDKLSPESQRQWGKMNVAQMMAHCTVSIEMAKGEFKSNRGFVGRVIGPLLKSHFTNDSPFKKSSPTTKELVIVDVRDFEDEKMKLVQKATAFSNAGPAVCTTNPHPFFGKLTPQQWGMGMYKHLDHHLKQFGV